DNSNVNALCFYSYNGQCISDVGIALWEGLVSSIPSTLRFAMKLASAF
ncbi:MAG: hypothetical protein ACI965_000344, partial [Paraglaciecola sp.]